MPARARFIQSQRKTWRVPGVETLAHLASAFPRDLPTCPAQQHTDKDPLHPLPLRLPRNAASWTLYCHTACLLTFLQENGHVPIIACRLLAKAGDRSADLPSPSSSQSHSSIPSQRSSAQSAGDSTGNDLSISCFALLPFPESMAKGSSAGFT